MALEVTYRQRARRIVQAATCLILDADLYAHDARTPFESVEDSLTAALQLAAEEERHACADLVQGRRPRGVQAQKALDRAAADIRARRSNEAASSVDPFGFSYDQD